MSLSQTALQQILAERSGAVLADLLTVDHEDFSEPERFVRDMKDLDYGGVTYTAAAFDIAYPEDTEDNKNPRAKLQIDNVDRRLVEQIRTVSGSPSFTLETVLRMPDDSVEQVIAPRTYDSAEFSYDQTVVEGNLGFEDILNMPATKDRFTPSSASGLF